MDLCFENTNEKMTQVEYLTALLSYILQAIKIIHFNCII
jgi:hypothetical protein